MRSKGNRQASHWMIGLLALAGTALASGETLAVDTPFTLTNNTDVEFFDVECVGPWMRDSAWLGNDEIEPGQSLQFYTATGGLFDQFGDWSCVVCQIEVNETCQRFFDLDFCLFDDPNRRAVQLTTTGSGGDYSFSVLAWPTECPENTFGATTRTFLGDAVFGVGQNALRSRGVSGDVDHYFIDGTAGDLLHIRVERDGARGSQGTQLKIEFSQNIGASGGSFTVSHSGAVPLEFEEMLPFSGTYSIAIEQPDAKVEDPFHGYYILRVTSDFGEDLTLRPHTTAEP